MSNLLSSENTPYASLKTDYHSTMRSKSVFKWIIMAGLITGVYALWRMGQSNTLLGQGRQTGFEMVAIPAGVFTMGSLDGDDDEKPPHQVTLSAFQIGKYEVTQADWREIMGSDPSGLHFKGCDQCPVEMVSWNDAQEFLKKLNAQYPGKNYRLPTEAEWEYAARGGSKSGHFQYAGSDDLASIAWVAENAGGKTHPIGQKKANELGIFDLCGNVWELCQDRKRVYTAAAQQNPMGVGAGTVHRGGGWGDDGEGSRIAFRHDGKPDYKGDYLGFRLAFSQE